jgi:dihydropteroate synthase
MMSDTYLRPMGLIAGPAAALSVEAGTAAWLAGGPLAFTQVAIVTRAAGNVACQPMPVARLLVAADARQRQQMERLTALRPDVAGLSLARPLIMGIVNVTPDSFSDGGRFVAPDAAVGQALSLAAAGADVLDIGGESTRPGSDAVSEDEEIARVLPVIKGLVGYTAARISIDTRKARVMQMAADAGVHIINDVSALTHDPDSLQVAAESGLAVVLMHALGDPKTMQDDPSYDNVLLDVYDALAARIAGCRAGGIAPERLIVDPGIGFGKTLEHNLQLMDGLSLLHGLGVPVMFGASRKAFIGKLTGIDMAGDRVAGSLAANLAALAHGVQVIRVHDVDETRQALSVWQAVRTGRAS